MTLQLALEIQCQTLNLVPGREIDIIITGTVPYNTIVPYRKNSEEMFHRCTVLGTYVYIVPPALSEFANKILYLLIFEAISQDFVESVVWFGTVLVQS